MRFLMAAIAVLCVSVAGCGGDDGGGGGGGGDGTIRIASAPNVFLSALYVARDDGLFDREGLKVEITEVESGNDSIAALASGNAQYADVGLEDLVELREQGDDSVVMVHDILNRVTLTLVMRKDVAERKGVSGTSPLEERLRALKGLKIGITSPGAPTDTYMRYYLRSVGLNPERDAEIIAIGDGASLLAALETKQIDAYQLSPPTPYVAASEGFGVVLIDGPKGEVPDLDGFSYTGWAVSRQWAEDNPETAGKFSRVLTEATKKVKSQPDAVAEQIGDDLGSENRPAILRTIKGMRSALSDDGCFDPQVVSKTLNTMRELKIFEGEGDASEGDLWTNEYNDC